VQAAESGYTLSRLKVLERLPGNPAGVAVNDLNVWLRDNGGGFLNYFGENDLKDVTPAPAGLWGGHKAGNVDVWGGVLNIPDGQPIRSHVAQMPWLEPGCVQLLMRDESDAYFHLWMIQEQQMIRFTPEEDTEGFGWRS
jgi:hypothetical protein